MAGLRNAHGICPPEVLAFLMDLFKYNDNSKNRYSDNYYRAALIEALGATVTPVISVQQGYDIRIFIHIHCRSDYVTKILVYMYIIVEVILSVCSTLPDKVYCALLQIIRDI